MPYLVELPDKTRDQINSWSLPTHVLRPVLQSLNDRLMHATPLQVGRQIDAPIRCKVCSEVFRDEGAGIRHDFLFWINDTKQPDTRIIIEAAHRSRSIRV